MVAVHAGALLSINPGPELDSGTAIFFAGMVAIHEPRLLAASVGVLSVTAILAAWIPALRHESSP